MISAGPDPCHPNTETSLFITGTSGNDTPTPADLEKIRAEANELRSHGRMLLFSGDLHSAVNGIADDVDQVVDIAGSVKSGGTLDDLSHDKVAQLLSALSSMNTDARAGQRACGIPVKGIFTD